MRDRILCLVLLGLLLAPAAGWAKGSEIDPNGQPVSEQGAGVDLVSVAEGNAAEALPAPGGSLWGLFSRWLESLGLSL